MPTHSSKAGIQVDAVRVPAGATITLQPSAGSAGLGAPPNRTVPASAGDYLVTFPSGEILVIPAQQFALLFGPA